VVYRGQLEAHHQLPAERRLVWDQLGLGGLPSNHTAVVSSTAVLIGLREGVNTALFAIAVTLAIIVILDALNLRREVGAHAAALNELLGGNAKRQPFREHVGHRQVEVLTGFLVADVTQLVSTAPGLGVHKSVP
jgi:acid phosphatase family membrane protein YuiD